MAAAQISSPITDNLKCIGIALAAVPPSYIENLLNVLTTITSVLRGYNTVIQAEIRQIDINTIPLALQLAGATKAAQKVTGAIQVTGAVSSLGDTVMTEINIIESALANMCPALGQLNHIGSLTVKPALDWYKRLLAKKNRIRALKLSYEDLHDQIEFYISYLDKVKTYLQQLLQVRGSAQTIANIRLKVNVSP